MDTQSRAERARWGFIALVNVAVIAAGVRLQFPISVLVAPTVLDWAGVLLVPTLCGLAARRLLRWRQTPAGEVRERIEMQLLLLLASAWVLGLGAFWRQPGLFWLSTLGVLPLAIAALILPPPPPPPSTVERSVFRPDPLS